MRTLTKTLVTIFALFLAVHYSIAQPQIQFEGLYSAGEGGAAWDADGSGPEPYGYGHGSNYYYVASRDYVDASSTAGAHMLDNISGFPAFEQALLDNGFTAGQLTLKLGLASMGEDVEGIDWFTISTTDYSNFYPVHCTLELDGSPLLGALDRADNMAISRIIIMMVWGVFALAVYIKSFIDARKNNS